MEDISLKIHANDLGDMVAQIGLAQEIFVAELIGLNLGHLSLNL